MGQLRSILLCSGTYQTHAAAGCSTSKIPCLCWTIILQALSRALAGLGSLLTESTPSSIWAESKNAKGCALSLDQSEVPEHELPKAADHELCSFPNTGRGPRGDSYP